MNICICGGGNLGHVTAGYLAAKKDYNVFLLTRHPEKWSRKITIDLPQGKSVTGVLSGVSSSAEEIIPSADLVLVCLPGMYIRQELESIRPYLKKETAVGTVVSSTGFFFQAHDIIPTQPLFGFQRVPFISRIIEYGHSAALLGFKKSLAVAMENVEDTQRLRLTLEQMFDTPITMLGSYYEASLSNSNPLLHTSRLYSMWHNWEEGMVYPRQTLFYEEWTVDAAQLYIDMDQEFQQLLRVLGVSKEAIPPVLKYYESKDAQSLCRKIQSIKAFKQILSPMKKVDGGWIPDVASRYFTEDFGFGLRFIYNLGVKNNVEMPNIDTVFAWGNKIIGNQT